MSKNETILETTFLLIGKLFNTLNLSKRFKIEVNSFFEIYGRIYEDNFLRFLKSDQIKLSLSSISFSLFSTLISSPTMKMSKLSISEGDFTIPRAFRMMNKIMNAIPPKLLF